MEFNKKYEQFKLDLILLINQSGLPLTCIRDSILLTLNAINEKINEILAEEGDSDVQ